MSCTATLRHPTASEINVRSGPGTDFDVAFKGAVGTAELVVQQVRVDSQSNHLNGKVYQWFQLQFPDGTQGWVRDDLLDIQGDCSAYGYNTFSMPTYAFGVSRREKSAAPAAKKTQAAPAITLASASSVTSENELDRVRRAALAVTAAFEGSGYAAYNNYDAGIISYGIIQFTLAAGTLSSIVNQYLLTSRTAVAEELRVYKDRISSRDANLRDDANLKRILIAASDEPEMRQAQDNLATANYWTRLVDNYITPRGYQFPLTYALLFDIGVNFGVGDGFVRMAEKEYGIPSVSDPSTSGISEEQIITKVAELRRRSHYKQAERDNLPGLKLRGDFWVKLVQQGDWNFQGDMESNMLVNGRKVQVRTP